MKKFGMFLMLLGLVAFNFGCNKPAAEPAAEPEAETPAEPEAPAEPAAPAEGEGE